MKFFVIRTGLHPGVETLEEVVTKLESDHSVIRYDATQPKLSEKDWDCALNDLIAADGIISI